MIKVKDAKLLVKILHLPTYFVTQTDYKEEPSNLRNANGR